MKPVIALAGMLLAMTPLARADGLQADKQVLDLGTLDTGRPAKVTLWYPRGDCHDAATRFCLADSAVTRKVVVMSHGSMGSASDLSWLGERLASEGFVVVGVNHFGESSIYGADTRDARSSGFTWQRAQEVSAMLTRLGQGQLFQASIDWNTAIAVGFSAGGQTTALLAGARYDLRQLAVHCASDAGKTDLSCNYGGDAGRAPDAFVAAFDASYQDTRVKKIVLMDPALGSAVRLETLRALKIPSLHVGAVHSDILPWASHGARYAAGLSHARTLRLEGQEGHFVFVTPCRLDVKVLGVPLCEDRPGVDRAAVQERVANAVVEFVRTDDEPQTVARIATRSVHSIPGNTLLQILHFTPRWVFGLLVALVIVGSMQARTRRVPVGLALTLPAAMLLLSLTSVLRDSSLTRLAPVAWLLGLGIATALGLRVMRADAATYDAGSRRLVIAGSRAPLFVILGIFLVRYAIGVVNGMNLELARIPAVVLGAGLLLGAFSGFFVARGLRFWRVHAAHRTV